MSLVAHNQVKVHLPDVVDAAYQHLVADDHDGVDRGGEELTHFPLSTHAKHTQSLGAKPLAKLAVPVLKGRKTSND